MSIFGILGGNGASATTRFHTLVTQKILDQGFYEDKDFLEMIIVNSPNKIINPQGKINDKQEFLDHLTEISPTFNRATHMLVLCNTFHIYETYMKEIFNGEFISLPQITRSEAIRNNVKKPLLLSSQTTKTYRIYDSTELEITTLAVPELIELGMKGETISPLFAPILELAKTQDNDAIILGCTDLSTFTQYLKSVSNIPIIDSLETAVNHIIKIDKES